MTAMPHDRLRPGLSAAREHIVTDVDTAAAMGSGDLAVLGTPRLLAWLEQSTRAAVASALPAGQTSVGTRMSLEHVRASPVGAKVAVAAELVHVDGRLLRFQVEASHADGDDAGVVTAHGEITRVIVDADRFLARLS